MSVVIFKPDEIGDFVIATGAIRTLAREHGEENTTLVVKSSMVPLARREFPRAAIVGLPWQPRRKGSNQTMANLRHCFPAWQSLRALRADQSVFLRSQRSYVQTLLFASSPARQRFAPSNTLLRKGRMRRRAAEELLSLFARPRILPYPVAGAEPTAELASHRAVVSAAVGRSVGLAEIMPALNTAPWRGGTGWLLCPLSSRPAKDYDAARWASAMQQAAATCPPSAIRLAGAPEQNARLHNFAEDLRRGGLSLPVEVLTSEALDKFPDTVAGADLVLAVDSAAAHFACATGAPAVVVDSGLHPGVYAPYSPNGRQFWLVGDRAKLGRSRWQESVPPAAVAGAILRALGS